MERRVFTYPGRKVTRLTRPPWATAWATAGFDFPTQTAGRSAWTGSDGKPVNVLYDPATGTNGKAAAAYAAANIDALMAFNDWCFGVRGKGGNLIVAAVGQATDGAGGAYHYGCGFGAQGGDWYCDVSPDARETFGLAQAEITESYMGLQGAGWNCGGSGGEGLSRVLAQVVSGGPDGSLGAYASAPSWEGTDWITHDQGTDQDYPSIGAAVLYLFWMLKKGFSMDKITQAGEPDGTLASNYSKLTGEAPGAAFAAFKAAVQTVGGPGGFRGDNPFQAPLPAYPLSGTPPPPPPPPPVGAGPSEAAVQAAVDGRLAKWAKSNPRYASLLKAVAADLDKTIRAAFAQSLSGPPAPDFAPPAD